MVVVMDWPSVTVAVSVDMVDCVAVARVAVLTGSPAMVTAADVVVCAAVVRVAACVTVMSWGG